MKEAIEVADQIIASMDVDPTRVEHLPLPGGEIDVWPKNMGKGKYFTSCVRYLWKCFATNDRWEQRIAEYNMFYEPPIPRDLWFPKTRVRSTREIQLRETLLRVYPDMAMAERFFGPGR